MITSYNSHQEFFFIFIYHNSLVELHASCLSWNERLSIYFVGVVNVALYIELWNGMDNFLLFY